MEAWCTSTSDFFEGEINLHRISKQGLLYSTPKQRLIVILTQYHMGTIVKQDTIATQLKGIEKI